MAISNAPAQLWVDSRLAAHGMCHLIERDATEAGTISRLTWTGDEPNLTGRAVVLKLPNDRHVQALVTRHAHPEGRTILRFSVLPHDP